MSLFYDKYEIEDPILNEAKEGRGEVEPGVKMGSISPWETSGQTLGSVPTRLLSDRSTTYFHDSRLRGTLRETLWDSG